MERKPVPYKKTVFVCTNARADGRVACANPGRGGKEICEALKEAVKKAGLKGKVRVARSGCLDLCEKGPNLFVYPEGEWRSGLTLADVPELVEKLKRESDA
jgi:(2Fe-2S) ferredoxin